MSDAPTKEELLAQRAALDRQIKQAELVELQGSAAAVTAIVGLFGEYEIDNFVAALRSQVETLKSGPARMQGEATLQQFSRAKRSFEALGTALGGEVAKLEVALAPPAPTPAPPPAPPAGE